MTAATLILDAAADGVELRMVAGELKVAGDRAPVSRWLPAIREHKAELLRLLPKLDDVDDEGRAAGERIWRALQRPSGLPVAEPAGPRSWGWLIRYPDHETEKYILPEQTQAEVLASHPGASAVEPLDGIDSTEKNHARSQDWREVEGRSGGEDLGGG